MEGLIHRESDALKRSTAGEMIAVVHCLKLCGKHDFLESRTSGEGSLADVGDIVGEVERLQAGAIGEYGIAQISDRRRQSQAGQGLAGAERAVSDSRDRGVEHNIREPVAAAEHRGRDGDVVGKRDGGYIVTVREDFYAHGRGGMGPYHFGQFVIVVEGLPPESLETIRDGQYSGYAGVHQGLFTDICYMGKIIRDELARVHEGVISDIGKASRVVDAYETAAFAEGAVADGSNCVRDSYGLDIVNPAEGVVAYCGHRAGQGNDSGLGGGIISMADNGKAFSEYRSISSAGVFVDLGSVCSGVSNLRTLVLERGVREIDFRKLAAADSDGVLARNGADGPVGSLHENGQFPVSCRRNAEIEICKGLSIKGYRGRAYQGCPICPGDWHGRALNDIEASAHSFRFSTLVGKGNARDALVSLQANADNTAEMLEIECSLIIFGVHRIGRDIVGHIALLRGEIVITIVVTERGRVNGLIEGRSVVFPGRKACEAGLSLPRSVT